MTPVSIFSAYLMTTVDEIERVWFETKERKLIEKFYSGLFIEIIFKEIPS